MGTTKTSPPLGRTWGAAFGFALAALTPLSCSFVFDADTEQCLVDGDCAKRGSRFADAICVDQTCQPAPAPPVDPVWGCLDQPPPDASATETVNLQLKVALNGDITKPSTNARVRACTRLDAPCESPLGNREGVPVEVTGVATLQVPQTFDGYLEVFGPEGPNTNDVNFVPAMVFFPRREVLREGENRGVYVFSRTQINNLATLGGGSFVDVPGENPALPETKVSNGIVVLTALTCESKTAQGVSFSLFTEGAATTATSQFYTFMNIPSPQPTESDSSGTSGFTNIKPGLVAFTATRNEGQRLITAPGGTGVYVRPGWYTQVYVAP